MEGQHRIDVMLRTIRRWYYFHFQCFHPVACTRQMFQLQRMYPHTPNQLVKYTKRGGWRFERSTCAALLGSMRRTCGLWLPDATSSIICLPSTFTISTACAPACCACNAFSAKVLPTLSPIWQRSTTTNPSGVLAVVSTAGLWSWLWSWLVRGTEALNGCAMATGADRNVTHLIEDQFSKCTGEVTTAAARAEDVMVPA